MSLPFGGDHDSDAVHRFPYSPRTSSGPTHLYVPRTTPISKFQVQPKSHIHLTRIQNHLQRTTPNHTRKHKQIHLPFNAVSGSITPNAVAQTGAPTLRARYSRQSGVLEPDPRKRGSCHWGESKAGVVGGCVSGEVFWGVGE